MISQKQINQFKIKELNAILIVLINGVFSKDLSEKTEGLDCKNTKENLTLNIKQNLISPIHIISVFNKNTPSTINQKNIIIGENIKVKIIKTYHSINNQILSANTTSNITLKKHADLKIYELQNETKLNINNTIIIDQNKNSELNYFTFTLNGELIQNNIEVNLNEEQSKCNINGLYVLSGSQRIENNILINHFNKNCISRQSFRGVIDDNAYGIFKGKIFIAKNGEKAIANQSNKNLLLSDNAKISSIPSLEVYTDDVKCTHGATSGQLNKEKLFYLQARGINMKKAKELLTFAFASKILEKIEIKQLKIIFNTLLTQRLKKGCKHLN